jgi:hypothetical protein
MHWVDPDHLPEFSGIFERFLLNPHGEADGMMLADGTEVHFPPHMSDDICAAIGPDEKPFLRIRGVRPRGADVIAAVALETADGQRFLDRGPGEAKSPAAERPARQRIEAEGIVWRHLHGPKGELRGVLLADGCMIRMPPPECERFADLLVPGATLAVRGDGLVLPLGTVIEAHEIGRSIADLGPIKPKKPKHEKDEDKAQRASPA